MLAKSTNSRIINKGNIHKEIFLKSLNDLNLIYLYWANRFQDDKNNFFFFDYDLDNELLSFFDEDNNIKLDVYNLFLQSTNSQHALSVSNRKFFWNSIENFFEPINYDSNPAIERAKPTTTTVDYRFPVSKYVKKSFIRLEQKLDSVDVEKLYENLLIGGIDLSRQEIKNKLKKISSNLEIIKETYFTKIEKEKIEHNSFKSLNNIKGKFINAIKEIDPNTNLIRYDKKKNIFEKCKVHSGECANIEVTNDNLSILLEGELIIENTNYQYLGTTLSIEDLQNKKNNFFSTIIDGSKIFYEDGVEVNISDLSKVIEINQKEAGARTYVMGGTLSDYQIYFNGFNIMENDNSQNLKLFPPNFPIDNKNLTGCLSFINLDLKNINIKAKNSSCEDTVNFINVSGNINSIELENSFSDALDVDFSNLDFKNIKIINALNDCVDFSAGRYNLGNLNLSKCGDKGLSIGEKSSVFLKRLLVNNANLGVATKDGSYLDLKFANMSNLKICVSAYNKKQEFTGGFIEIEKLNCEKYFKKADSDNLSKIFLEKKLIENNIYGEFYNPSDLKISKVEGKTIKKHLIKDFRAFNKDGSVNAAVEINSGIKEKWEISRISGYLSREFYMGSPRSIQHTPYPVNYGMIPRTILPVNRGGDGDPLDIIILGESLPQGKVVKVKPLGVMKMTDSGEQDDKIIAVPINSPLVKFNNLDHFKNEKPEVLNNIKEWFINYKGKNIVEFINFESDEEAKFIIKDAAKNYKRSGLKERS